MEQELNDKIRGLAKRYQSMQIISPELTDELSTIRGEITNDLKSLSPEEQDMFTHNLRESSIAVNGQPPQTHTGYGVIREIFCDILVDRLSDSAQRRYSMIQNGLGQSQSASDITTYIRNTMISLPEDQFEVFTQAVNNYVVPTENQGFQLTQPAINRLSFGINEVRNILAEVTAERARRNAELESDGMGEM
ncbi:MAG: hypothetical protein E7354_04645 [Clostridiales bacterium]|nr:hypothetical protein [Clostridiales bacterium]